VGVTGGSREVLGRKPVMMIIIIIISSRVLSLHLGSRLRMSGAIPQLLLHTIMK
jgi:hypothetical protein